MKASNGQANIVSTDVLIIGGSLAGLTGAVKIKELQGQIDVVIVDKGGVGWAGLVPTGGGHLIAIPPEVNLDEWVNWIAGRGEGLSNIAWLYNFGGSLHESLMELFGWGLAFMKDPDGKLHIEDVPRQKDKLVGWVTHRVLLQLKKRALGKGVKILNKIEMVDLLKNKGRIVGAIGFSILTGEFYVFKAKAVLIASGSCRYKNRRLWTMDCGEMVAAAYRAGAQHLHSEFGISHSNCSKVCQMWTRSAGLQDALVNAEGEKIMEKYFPNISEAFSKTAYAMVKEVMAGRGPIYFDATGIPTQFDEKIMDGVVRFTSTQGGYMNPERILREKGGVDLRSQKVEWIPGFIGCLGNIKVDLECKSPDLEGLWVAGDAMKNGIAMEGAHPAGEYSGWGLTVAMVTGLKAGKSIVKVLPETQEASGNTENLEAVRNRLFLPMTLEKGFKPYDAVLKIHQAIVPAKYNVVTNEDRLKEALGIIEEVQKEVLPKVKTTNPHEMLKYSEASSMALCAEMTLRAALFRTETRGSHVREDYPERDDGNWLKWTIIRKENERMTLSAIPVPKWK